jgi:DNA-binding response OmpR family regulator
MALVVVADDDADVRDLVTFKLEQLGVEVAGAGDGPTAMALVRERQPALLVLDIAMPGMSGIEVCRMIRAEPAIAATPIIMLTARAQEHDVEGGFAAGADDYVTKPFSPRELASRVQTMLARTGT